MASYSMLRRAMLLSGLCLGIPSPALSQITLPTSLSLVDDLNKALTKRNPLIVMVILDGCPYWQIVSLSNIFEIFSI